MIVVSGLPPLVALAWLRPVYFGLLVAFVLYVLIAMFALGVLWPLLQRDIK
jgi:hypothetical protein